MASSIRTLSTDFAVTGQLAPQDLREVAARGFGTVINNRPDGEGGSDQPSSGELERAARAAGLHYLHLPVVSGGITPEQAAAMRQARKAVAFYEMGIARLLPLRRALGQALRVGAIGWLNDRHRSRRPSRPADAQASLAP